MTWPFRRPARPLHLDPDMVASWAQPHLSQAGFEFRRGFDYRHWLIPFALFAVLSAGAFAGWMSERSVERPPAAERAAAVEVGP